MSKVTTINAGSASIHRSEEPTGEPTSKRKASSRVQKERNVRKGSPDTSRARGQSKRRKKKANAKKDDTANDKSAVMEEDTEDQLVVYENEDNEDDEQTDSDDSTTDSDTDTDSDEEDVNMNPNTLRDEDDEEEDEDEVMDDDFYARRRRSMLGYNASFNYTRLAIEKLTDHPIVLRGCDTETMWESKELTSLQEDLRSLYKKARQRIKTMKRDVRKLETELQRKRDLAAKRSKTQDCNITDVVNGNDAKNKDVKQQQQRVCGVMNSRGNPCQRTGFCPFHHKLTSSRALPRPYDFFKRREETNFDEPVETAMVASGPKERQEKMQVSILLVAAAALERKGIDESDVMKDDTPPQEAPILAMPQMQRQQEQFQHEPLPHSFMHANQIPNNPFFGKPFNALPQLPSLHDMSERPPPYYDIASSIVRTEQQDSFMHGIPRNTAM